MTMASKDLESLQLDLQPNEASGLLFVEAAGVLEAHGWQRAFWVVLDESAAQECVAAIGQRPDGEWDVARLAATVVGDLGETRDAEALARRDGWIYVVGSQFGGKSGPLLPRQAFVARFREGDVERLDGGPVQMQVARPGLLLHRLVNDALAQEGVALVTLGDVTREAFIDQSLREGAGESWVGEVHERDTPINVEGATFRAAGTLLLGLRYPVSVEGRPLLVELEGVERLFDGGDPPTVVATWIVDAVGRDGDMAGVRDLSAVGDDIHLVTGNLDSRPKNSVVLHDYPGGRDTVSTHWRVTLPPDAHGGHIAAELVREFPDMHRIEGIASDDDGRWFYVSDEDDHVRMEHTRLISDA
jgi:hypothetical protein